MITRKELIKKYIEFFKTKGHAEIPNASLIPEEDPTTLFIGSGVETIIPYVLGRPHPLGKRLTNYQKSIRTTDIEEVGDTYHHTFFEMIGNWSLGDYWKKEAVEFTFEFVTKILKVPIERLAVTVFAGDNNAPKDTESEETWLNLGIPKERIAFLPKKDNFWGPAGKTGPCGPNTEIFYWKPNDRPAPKEFNPNDERWVELGNDVLMEYNKNEKGEFEKLKQKNIDFGGGVERIVAILNGLEDNYLAEMWKPIIEKIEELLPEKIDGSNYTSSNEDRKKAMRIIADHIKASCFIIADGITPSNSDQGYVLRRLIRRAVRSGKQLEIEKFTKKIAEPVFEIYDDYPELQKNKNKILDELEKEENKFLLTLEKGLRVFENWEKRIKRGVWKDNKKIKWKEGSYILSGKDAFLLYQSYGFPIELTEELAKEKNIQIDKKDFEEELKKHQELSRTASAGRFKSGLADNSVATTRLHTAAHLLLKSLQVVLDDKNILQRGSNITPERLRLDFNFDRKLTSEEIKKVEDLVNEKINEKIEVVREEMSPEEAKEKGAQGIFDKKYPDIVSVYTIGSFSKEICTGPHVKNTSELGKFKIKKQESSSAGVRRIKAVLE